MIWQSSTVGHTELTRIVSYYRFRNADPGASFLNKFLRLRKSWRLRSVAHRREFAPTGFFKKTGLCPLHGGPVSVVN
jgi:hypothetical protein